MLKILGKETSINVRKVLWTCMELDIPFDYDPRGLRENSKLLKSLNPNNMVPVIVDKDVVLWESNAICRYLASSYEGYKILPECVIERAKVEQWMDWQATEFNSAWKYAFMGLVRKHENYQDKYLQKASIYRWNNAVEILAMRLVDTGEYITGSEFTLADIVIGLSLNRWKKAPIPHIRHSAIDAYLEHLNMRPAFQKYNKYI